MHNGIRKYCMGLRKLIYGYTVIELLVVSSIVVILAVMALGSGSNMKRFSTEEKAVSRLRQLADAQERYKFSNDPSYNPEGSYATFDELQLGNFIPIDYVEDDVRQHTVQAFVPYYRLDILRSPSETDEEPDANHYYAVIYPIGARWELKTFHMLEDGEIWHTYGLRYYER